VPFAGSAIVASLGLVFHDVELTTT
jgi:hypothetical protein